MNFVLNFFTDPYKDELLYSALARYHYYSGNIDFLDTIEECFGKRTVIPTLEIGSYLDVLAKNIGGKYTSDYLINKHTLLPYYLPFMPEERKKEVIDRVKHEDCNGVYNIIGLLSGVFKKRNEIYYCPSCAKLELETYSQAYIHREHQLSNIILCPHHGQLLRKFPLKLVDRSRVEYINLYEGLLCTDLEYKEIENYSEHLKLAKDALWIINSNLDNINKSTIRDAYSNLLYEKGLVNNNKVVSQNELCIQFNAFYKKTFWNR